MGQVAQNQGLTILMKFGKEKNLKSLQSGLMYMKNLAYYVGQERKILMMLLEINMME